MLVDEKLPAIQTPLFVAAAAYGISICVPPDAVERSTRPMSVENDASETSLMPADWYCASPIAVAPENCPPIQTWSERAIARVSSALAPPQRVDQRCEPVAASYFAMKPSLMPAQLRAVP